VAELRARGYAPAVASYGGHLAAVGGRWNFQGNPRLAALVGRSLRSVQRYRARLEADGLLRSWCLEPGDMIDGQRAPVSRAVVVREVTNLCAPALERLATRRSPPRRTKGQRRQRERARAIVAPPPASPAPLTVEEMLAAAKRPGVATWVAEALQGQGRGNPRPPPRADRAPCSPEELDAIDAELRELERRQRERERARPPPPPD
jgi:hypothetical protein